MKVKELIAALEGVNPDADIVLLLDQDFGHYGMARSVELRKGRDCGDLFVGKQGHGRRGVVVLTYESAK